MNARRVAVLACGGTIAAVPGRDGPATPRRGAADIVGAAGRLDGVEFTVRDVARTSSRAMTPADMLRPAADVEAAAADADGVVVTHGTDTLEETTYFLARTCATDRPLVLTGAMRHAGHPAPDGGANVRASLSLAASDDAAGRGPLVVFADEVHAARWVTKAQPMAQALAKHAGRGLPIVLATRCPAGPTLARTYDGPGSETALLAAGLLPAGRLSAVKCRLRLLVALAVGLPASSAFPAR